MASEFKWLLFLFLQNVSKFFRIRVTYLFFFFCDFLTESKLAVTRVQKHGGLYVAFFTFANKRGPKVQIVKYTAGFKI